MERAIHFQRANGAVENCVLVVVLCVVTLGALVAGGVPDSEREGLMQLYLSTQGQNWYWVENWGHGDPCVEEWYGVHCDENLTTVVKLNLGNNNLVGVIPASFGNLPNLESLQLSFNTISSAESLAPLSSLESLRVLYLDENNLDGPMPEEFGNLPHLQVLTLKGNALSGSLPDLANTTHLAVVDLSFNKLDSTIPEIFFASHPSLVHLYLNDNALASSLPTALCRATLLKTLSLTNNLLRQSLPSCMGRLSSLQTLYLGHNLLSGPLDAVWGMTSLTVLAVDENEFGSTLSSRMGALSALTTVKVDSNSLLGTMPSEIGRLSKLRILTMSDNDFGGRLPPDLGNTALAILEGDNNHFEFVPDGVFSETLELLSLSFNSLSGTLSDAAVNRSALLAVLNLNGNFLEGTIPASLGQKALLSTLDLSENDFVGTLPLLESARMEYFDVHSNSLDGNPCSSFALLNSSQSLFYLDISHNQFSGRLCSNFGSMYYLQSAYMSYNQFSGTIPEVWWSVTSGMRDVDISYNNIEGTLPNSESVDWRLEHLSARQNSLEGMIPTYIGFGGVLLTLDLGENSFEGEIPESLQYATNLESLKLDNNVLKGSIPDIFSFTSNLRTLHLQSNLFAGTLRSEAKSANLQVLFLQNNLLENIDVVVEYEKIRVLNVSHNLLSGKLPPFDDLLDLTSLDASYNNYTGVIPDFVSPAPGKPCVLTDIYLNNNALNSTIPSSLLSAPLLLVIDFHSNNLVGTIPEKITSFQLQTVDFSSNSLSGTLPEISALQAVLVADNELTGFLGTWVCDVPLFDGTGNVFYCPLPDCCGGHGTLCETLCIELPVPYFGAWWRVVYTVVGAVLLLLLGTWWACTMFHVPSRMRRRLGYGTFKQRSVEVEHIEVLGVLGSGFAGDVRKALWMRTTVVAVKALSAAGEVSAQDFEKEAGILLSVRHPNVLQFLGIYRGPRGPELVTEFMQLGSLLDVLRRENEILFYNTRLSVCADLAAGIAYLHHRQICHRDIAARNVLVKQERDGLIAKIGDFGHARLMNDRGLYVPPAGVEEMLAFKWCAPEIFVQRVFSRPSDVFAIGVTFWEVFNNGEEPRSRMGVGAVRSAVLGGECLPYSGLLNRDLYDDIIVPCLLTDPSSRPTATDLHELLAARLVHPDEPSFTDSHVSSIVMSGDKSDGLYVYSSRLLNLANDK